MAVADTINEINSIINDLKGLAEAGTKLKGADKLKMEARITHLRDKTQPKATGGDQLDNDLTDLQTKATTNPTAGKTPIVGLGWRLIGLKS